MTSVSSVDNFWKFFVKVSWKIEGVYFFNLVFGCFPFEKVFEVFSAVCSRTRNRFPDGPGRSLTQLLQTAKHLSNAPLPFSGPGHASSSFPFRRPRLASIFSGQEIYFSVREDNDFFRFFFVGVVVIGFHDLEV